MNKKLILLGIILLIIILLGCVFITNEGFKNKETFECSNPTSKCEQSNCALYRTIEECTSKKSTEGCEWDNTKCKDATSDDDDDANCNKITVTNSVGSKTELSIHNVCPSDPKCVAMCIDDHTWINPETSNASNKYNNIMGNDANDNAALKSNDSKHLVTSSRCMECIKNFYPITTLIENHSCQLGKLI